MSFQIKEFATIRISVADVGKSRDWYRAFFGIDPVEDLEGFASFRIGTTSLDICKADEKSPISRGGSVGYWLVSNLKDAVATAKDLGGIIYRGPLHVKQTGRTIIQIADPFGNVIGLEAEN